MLSPGMEETARAAGAIPAINSARAVSRETSPSSRSGANRFSDNKPSTKAMPNRNSKPDSDTAGKGRCSARR